VVLCTRAHEGGFRAYTVRGGGGTYYAPPVHKIYNICVRHVTGTGTGLLGEIPRVVVQKSALSKGPL
jgi:hypothetical protein